VLVTFEQAPISFEYLRSAVQIGLNFNEVVDSTQAPSYTVNSTCLRFPSSALSTALLSGVQQIIPLMHIRVRESAVADIYLLDRRVTIGGQFLPASPDRHRRTWLRRADLTGHQRHLR
jgi:hypothetical protein